MDYEFEDIREFIVRRSWFMPKILLSSKGDYEKLRWRILQFDRERAFYLRAFIDGYKAAKS